MNSFTSIFQGFPQTFSRLTHLCKLLRIRRGSSKITQEQDKVLRFHPFTPMIKSCSFCDCDGNHTEKSYVSKNIKKNNLH